ncbi:hypothetical protein D9757_009414 [Collybiopsis confluens]|uniref:Phospholipid/glycerol acyltransferase domain-containing protein n=1 Tax=Collybiopsis confluens TaxID=2823264 RepID=A0A8H5HDQ7_9AGAR|nr:hypothetical protein D9757_009414 [Collybiopsis confluens]
MAEHDYFILHRLIRYITGIATVSFFTEIRIVGGENVPKTGPIIVCATHHNMMLDPMILSSTFPNKRILHYWSKASLFANPIVRNILLSSGNIPVDRKSKDRQVLFRGTFETLSQGHAVALFPEGTSYTEPQIMQVKDGAAWAALEFTKWAREHNMEGDVRIVPAAIVYTNKSKYRSNVIIEFSRPITLDPYKELFLSSNEGAPRAAVKKLSRTIEGELVEHTINAKDWDTLYAARMAREILWPKEGSINLDEFVEISQTLVDLFSTSPSTPSFPPSFSITRQKLLTYYSLLQSTNLTNSILSSLPLPRDLDPLNPNQAPLPSRVFTLFLFILSTLKTLLVLPFFVFPLLVYSPLYLLGRFGARLVEDEEETQAQNKVAFSLLGALLVIYPSVFVLLWMLVDGVSWTRWGAVVSAVGVWALGVYHDRTVTSNYNAARRLYAAWRILIGVWAPKRWDLSLEVLKVYATPTVPKENEWIDKAKKPKAKSDSDTPTPTSSTPTPSSPILRPPLTPALSTSDIGQMLPDPHLVLVSREEEPPVSSISKDTRTSSSSSSASAAPTTKSTGKRKRPATRRIMRHVLRARIEAVKALAGFFDDLERAGKGGGEKVGVYSSRHLARDYGWFEHPSSTSIVSGSYQREPVAEGGEDGGEGDDDDDDEGKRESRRSSGWRDAKEVIRYLKARGAKVPAVRAPRYANSKREGETDGEQGWVLSGTETETDA